MLNEWCLIESDPAVFTELTERMGVKNVVVEELITTDVSELMKFDNVYGLILLFKWDPSREVSSHGTVVKDAPVYFASQVVSNACATMALLNILCNNPDKIQLGEQLQNFLNFTQHLDPLLRGSQVGECEVLRVAHNSFAPPQLVEQEGSDSGHADSYHFESFVYRNGSVWELDGMQEDPILCEDATDVNYKSVLMQVVQKVIADISERDVLNTGKGISFVLMAVVDDPIPRLQARIEQASAGGELLEELQTELDYLKAEREKGRKENIRRRHNYVPMIIELLKALAIKGKLEPAIEELKAKKSSRAAKYTKTEE